MDSLLWAAEKVREDVDNVVDLGQVVEASKLTEAKGCSYDFVNRLLRVSDHFDKVTNILLELIWVCRDNNG